MFQMKFKKASLIFIVIFFTACLFFITAGKKVEEPAGTAEKVEESVELVIWYVQREGWDEYLEEVEKHIKDKFNVDLKLEPKIHDVWQESLATASVSQSGPDIISDWSGHSGAIAEGRAGLFKPLNDMLTDSLKKNINSWSLGTDNDGKIYAIPFSIRAEAMAYNKELVAKAGIDTSDWPNQMSFEEFSEACEKLKNAGITPISWANKEGWTAEMWWSSSPTFLFDSSEQMAKFFQEESMKDPKFYKASEKFKYLYDQGYTYPGGNTLGYGANYLQQFAREEAAFSIGGPPHYKYFMANMDTEKIGLTFMPRWSDEGAFAKKKSVPTFGEVFGITPWSDNKELALKVLEEMIVTDWGANIIFDKLGYIPAYTGWDIVTIDIDFLKSYYKEAQKYEKVAYGFDVWPKAWLDTFWKFNPMFLDGYISAEEFAEELDVARGIK